jgi:hypothetical protein
VTNESETHEISTSMDPAAGASAMLLRLGFAIFALVMPSATLMSRWVIVVLVPIGAVLIILSALLKDDPARIWRGASISILGFAGLSSLLLALWAMASLLWTPVQGEAAEKLFKAVGIIVLGLLAVSALPRRMRATNLHLVTIGVAIGALLILASALAEMAGSRILSIPAATPGRVAVLLTVIVWLGAGWMLIKDRPGFAAGLVLLVSLAVALSPTKEALMPLILAVIVVGWSWNSPERVGRLLGAGAAIAILAAPLVACVATFLPTEWVGGFAAWWELIRSEPLRFLTGHGFDSAFVARASGHIPAVARVSMVSDIWFDLGLLGAVATALIAWFSFRAVSQLGLELAPVALGALVAALAYALLERGATQTWWLNGMTVATIVLVSLERGRYRTVRPRARLGRRGAPAIEKTS